MPAISTLSGPSSKLSFTGRSLIGVSSPTVYMQFPTYSSQFAEWTFIAFGSQIVFGMQPKTRLYWNIKHITTNSADFKTLPNIPNHYGDHGWLYTIYATGAPAGGTTQMPRCVTDALSISIQKDNIAEGNETFAIEYRIGSSTGPVVGTTVNFTITDYFD